MSRRLVAAAFVSALVIATPPAVAAKAPAVSAADAAGDVKLLSDSGGLTVEQRRSIDLRKLTVNIRASSTRFVVKIRRITFSPDFEQMVFVTLRSPAGSSPAYRTDIGISAQTRDLAYANYLPDDTGEDVVVCDPLTAKVRPRLKVVLLDVPHECIPAGAVKIRLLSATGFFRSEGTGFSRDTMKVPGRHVLK
jgi:hypothetical protein